METGLSEEEEGKSVKAFMEMARQATAEGVGAVGASFKELAHELEECYRKNSKLSEMYQNMTEVVRVNAGSVQTLLATTRENENVIGRQRRELESLWSAFEKIECDRFQSEVIIERLENDRQNVRGRLAKQKTEAEEVGDIHNVVDDLKSTAHKNAGEIGDVLDDINQLRAQIRGFQEENGTFRAEEQDINRQMECEVAEKRNMEMSRVAQNEEIVRLGGEIRETAAYVTSLKKEIAERQSREPEDMTEYELALRQAKAIRKARKKRVSMKREKLAELKAANILQEEKNAIMDRSVMDLNEDLEKLESEMRSVRDCAEEMIRSRDDLREKRRGLRSDIESNQKAVRQGASDVDRFALLNETSESKKNEAGRVVAGVLERLAFAKGKLRGAKDDTDLAKKHVYATEIAVTGALREHRVDSIEMSCIVDDQSRDQTLQRVVRRTSKKLVKELTDNHLQQIVLYNDADLLGKRIVVMDERIADAESSNGAIVTKIHIIESKRQDIIDRTASAKSEGMDHKKHIRELNDECIATHMKTIMVERKIPSLERAVGTYARSLSNTLQASAVCADRVKSLTHTVEKAERACELRKLFFLTVRGSEEAYVRHYTSRCIQKKSLIHEIRDINAVLVIKSAHFDRQTKELDDMQFSLRCARRLHGELWRMIQRIPDQRSRIMTLEKKLSEVRIQRAALENVHDTPMNVHRWTLMQNWDGVHIRRLRVVWSLRKEIEDAGKRKVLLLEQKAQIQREISDQEKRISNIGINDDARVVILMKNLVREKDRLLISMEAEMKEQKINVAILAQCVTVAQQELKELERSSSSRNRRAIPVTRPAIRSSRTEKPASDSASKGSRTRTRNQSKAQTTVRCSAPASEEPDMFLTQHPRARPTTTGARSPRNKHWTKRSPQPPDSSKTERPRKYRFISVE